MIAAGGKPDDGSAAQSQYCPPSSPGSGKPKVAGITVPLALPSNQGGGGGGGGNGKGNACGHP